MDESESLAPIPRYIFNITTCTCGIAMKLVQLNDQFTNTRDKFC